MWGVSSTLARRVQRHSRCGSWRPFDPACTTTSVSFSETSLGHRAPTARAAPVSCEISVKGHAYRLWHRQPTHAEFIYLAVRRSRTRGPTGHSMSYKKQLQQPTGNDEVTPQAAGNNEITPPPSASRIERAIQGRGRGRTTTYLASLALAITLLGAGSGLGAALIWPKTYGARGGPLLPEPGPAGRRPSRGGSPAFHSIGDF